MKLEKIAVTDLIPYKNNAKLHPADQVEQIAESIRQFGFNDPIAVDENNMIIEGHGRWLALKKLGWAEAECLRLIGLTDDQKHAYILIHNKLTMETGFDYNMLDAELARISEFDMSVFGFGDEEIDLDINDLGEDFTLNNSEAPQVRTFNMNLTPEQNEIWTTAIQAAEDAGIISNPSSLTNAACNAVAAIVHQWLEGDDQE